MSIYRLASIIIKWWWGGNPDDNDPISGLSRRDVYNIQKSWATIYKDADKYGMELFKRLFRADTESKNFFKKIKHMDEATYSASFQFKAHIVNFMSSFNTAVVTLNQPEVVVALMNKLGERHGKINIEKKHFEIFKGILVNFLVNDLKMDTSTLKSWEKLVNFIYTHIYENLPK